MIKLIKSGGHSLKAIAVANRAYCLSGQRSRLLGANGTLGFPSHPFLSFDLTKIGNSRSLYTCLDTSNAIFNPLIKGWQMPLTQTLNYGAELSSGGRACTDKWHLYFHSGNPIAKAVSIWQIWINTLLSAERCSAQSNGGLCQWGRCSIFV